MNFNITGNGKMIEKRAVFNQILRFFHQYTLMSKGKHRLLSCHDYFDYNSTDFSQIIEKLGCGWGEQPSVFYHLDVKEMSVSNISGALTH